MLAPSFAGASEGTCSTPRSAAVAGAGLWRTAGDDFDAAEDPVDLVSGAGGVEQVVSALIGRTVSKHQGPQPGDHQHVPAGQADRAELGSADGIEPVDRPVAKIADQQVAGCRA